MDGNVRVQLKPTGGVDDEWRRWIAENLLLDNDPRGIYETLRRAGIGGEEAEREVRQAIESPYLRGAQSPRPGRALAGHRADPRVFDR